MTVRSGAAQREKHGAGARRGLRLGGGRLRDGARPQQRAQPAELAVDLVCLAALVLGGVGLVVIAGGVAAVALARRPRLP